MRRSIFAALSLFALSACSSSGNSSVSGDTNRRTADSRSTVDTAAGPADVVDQVADIVVADMMAADVTTPPEDMMLALDTTPVPDLNEPDIPVVAGCPAAAPVGKQVGNVVPNMMFTDCETGEAVAMHEQCGSGPIWLYAFNGW